MKHVKLFEQFVAELNKETTVNEAKALGIGDQGVDYNDNVVEVIAIGDWNKIAKMFKQETKSDPSDAGYEGGKGDYYLTKTIKATSGKAGELAIYPVAYDYSTYWGLVPSKKRYK